MSAALDRCTALLGDANVRAFLHVIREGETNQTDDAYRMIFGGKLVDGPGHPWYGRTTTEVGHSTAYGAYQFLGTSWKEASDALGLGNDTSPVNQDLCAVWTIDVKRHAAAAVQSGDLVLACSKLATEWVSLPGLRPSRVERVFTDYGGKTAAQDHAGATIPPQPTPTYVPPVLQPLRPQPENSMLPAFLLQLLSSITGNFSPAGQAQITPMTGKPLDQLAPFLLDLFTKVAGATGVLPVGQPVTTNDQAIAAVAEFNKLKATNTELVAQIEEHALDYLDKISPFVKQIHQMEMEKAAQSVRGKDSAARRNLLDRWDMTRALVLSSEGLAWAIVLGAFSGVGAAIYVGQYNLALAILGIAGTITGNVLKNRSQAYDYRFDGTESSNAIQLSTDAVARALPKQP